ncbi:WSC domain-containing protein [Calycina marina]|uniref:WSC domain-containing protein n=1 Tax=Calycina marina TaxID=1763456 RepID=A0A9P7Z2L9_9HELO|nr:WSC domain-containing protein [Calycina marina]
MLARLFVFLAALRFATAQIIYPGDGSWTYKGCYNETTSLNSTGLRALGDGPAVSNSNMTVSTCLAFCKGYQYAGLEYTKECYCSYTISSQSAQTADIQCDLACVANATQYCGGSLKLSVYAINHSTKGAATRMSEKGLLGVMALGITGGLSMI